MDLREAKGYLQAVADNWNDAPKAQKAIQTVLDYVDFCYDAQNSLVEEIAEQHKLIADMSDELSHGTLASVRNELECVLSTIEELKKELVDERYRHDRMADFTVGQSHIIDELKKRTGEVRHGREYAPTAYVVEVVRCRDCKHRGTDECIFHIKGEPADEDLLAKLDNDFCSYGERRDSDG